MKEYVLGFLFSHNGQNVVLISKNRPQWQQGRLNGAGGKIESGEAPEAAMRREFKEETGLDIPQWTQFCILAGDDWAVTCFKAHSNGDVKSQTDEEVVRVSVAGVLKGHYQIIPNLQWIIPMALDNVRATVTDLGGMESK